MNITKLNRDTNTCFFHYIYFITQTTWIFNEYLWKWTPTICCRSKSIHLCMKRTHKLEFLKSILTHRIDYGHHIKTPPRHPISQQPTIHFKTYSVQWVPAWMFCKMKIETKEAHRVKYTSFFIICKFIIWLFFLSALFQMISMTVRELIIPYLVLNFIRNSSMLMQT